MKRADAALADSEATIVPLVQRTAQWYDFRRIGIGSSDAAAVLGLNPWRTPLQVYAEKVGLEQEPAEDNERMYWGSAIEPLVISRFRHETGRHVNRSQATVVNKARPWQFATVDAIQRKKRRAPCGAVEVKCTGLRRRWDDGVPDYVNAQVQHQLAVLGWEYASVAVLFFGNEFFWLDVERNDDFIRYLNEREEDFWRRVLAQEPPAAGASELDTKALAALYPVDNGARAALMDGEYVDADARRVVLKQAVEEAEFQLRLIDNRLKEAIGPNAEAVLSNGVRYTYKLQRREGYTVEPSEFRVLRRFPPRT